MKGRTTETPHSKRRWILGRATLVCVLLLIASACTGGTAATPSTAPSLAASNPAPSSVVEPSAAQASDSTGGLVVVEEHGLALTLPTGWLGLVRRDAEDGTKMDALRSEVGAESVDSLIAALEQHPEYWLVAMRPSDQNVLTAQLREAPDFDAWSIQQEQALIDTYGTVETAPVSAPREGVSFSWTSSGFDQRVYGFKRPGGVAIFTFASPAGSGAPEGWDAAIASFTDSGM